MLAGHDDGGQIAVYLEKGITVKGKGHGEQ
jgi:hypothetical protein